MAERVKEFVEKLIEGSQKAVFSRIVILASFFVIVARDIAIFVQISINSDGNQLIHYYNIFFLVFQVLWSYSSWIMLLLFFYPKNDDLPEAFECLEDEDKYLMEIFWKILGKLWLYGKSRVNCKCNNIWKVLIQLYMFSYKNRFISLILIAKQFGRIGIKLFKTYSYFYFTCCSVSQIFKKPGSLSLYLLIHFHLTKSLFIDVCRWLKDKMNSSGRGNLWVLITISILIFSYQITLGLLAISWCTIILLIPFLMLHAIKIAMGGVNFLNYDDDSDILWEVMSWEGLLIMWSQINNFVFMILLWSNLSIAMKIMEVLNVLVNLWFFAIIPLKADGRSSYTIICNPLVITLVITLAIIIGFVVLILLPLILPMMPIFICIKCWSIKCINFWKEVRKRHEKHEHNETFDEIIGPMQREQRAQRPQIYRENQDGWGICLDDVFEDQSRAKKLPCGHIFHENCIRQWVRSGRNTCPYCRRELN